ncbi:tellurite resistance TerB family protein [endosymbiont of Ridgeia piscesae]|jgi:uncharacterized tellurite resistance protein B-like protein|uniref:Putative conserved protein, tellurite resistance protein B (TerB) family n=1 Tax=endosymbiont of Ridgeia piscesae TaxID=54398 RepID=A0A0T5Z933_9GAMM|nr:TerB family tellurite resistance protein [endosymbiont of Ridgeia piscesae]KRT56225.1 hypothetical protein Ga0074115_13515 [endosymbiont of Ridgeia piscesae]KRT59372.1 putative conserved protein, tellurite resistance protein B (TerB) family [endosymbiont of Ridgeia piscesae]
MLDTIKRFFDTHLAPGSQETAQDPQHALRLAVAALLLEVAESDYRQHEEEKRALLDAVTNHFGLDTKEADQLVTLARSEQAASTDYFQFTRLINQHYSPTQKIALIEELWQVAFADDELHKYEEHLIRRLADLIHVAHGDFIAAKHRVLNSTK